MDAIHWNQTYVQPNLQCPTYKVKVAVPNPNYPQYIWIAVDTRNQHDARLVAECFGKITESDEDDYGWLTFSVDCSR